MFAFKEDFILCSQVVTLLLLLKVVGKSQKIEVEGK